MASPATERPPHWYGIPVRVLLVTFVGTLLCFAITLLLSIAGTVTLAAIRRVHPDMRIAYRMLAIPLAIIEGTVLFVFATVLEVRHYRQRKALDALERMG